LIIQGDLDRNVPAAEADRLAAAARSRKKSSPVELLHVPDADEKLASPKVAAAIAEWIKKLEI
jgi:fermentation-respiration switch protein FrsA (DUF1100 family)